MYFLTAPEFQDARTVVPNLVLQNVISTLTAFLNTSFSSKQWFLCYQSDGLHPSLQISQSFKENHPLDLAFCNLSQVLQSWQSSRWKTTFEPATVFEVYIICYNAHTALYKVCPKGVYHICLWWSALERTGKIKEQEEGRSVRSTVAPYSDMKGGKLGS